MKEFYKKIKEIKNRNLISENDKILIAFSGGPDSMFLYYILKTLQKEYNLKISLIYINHNLRDDVDNDIKIVTNFAKENGVKLYVKKIDVKKYAKDNKKSVELAARELRYEMINKTLMEIGYNKIATGHNLDDNVETLVFRLIRGTSIKGLKGIPIKRGNIIRPILHFEKTEIIKFLDEKKVEYVIDYTNFENDYTRNYIRNEIFPMFFNVNSNFKLKINELIEELNYNKISKNKRLLIEKLEEKKVELTREKINNIYNSLYDSEDELKKDGAKEFQIGENLVLRKKYDKIEIVSKKEKNEKEKNEKEKNETIKLNTQKKWNLFEIGIFNGENKILLNEYKKSNKIKFYEIKLNKKVDEIKIRARIDGDRIKLKNVGYKKIKKILIDKKISKWERDEIPIILYENEILAIGNISISDHLEKINIEEIRENMIILCIKEI